MREFTSRLMSLGNDHAIIGPALAGGAAAPIGEQRGLAIAGQPELEAVRPGRRGRPPGKRNYRTEALVSYLQSRGKMPAEMLHDVLRQGWRRLAGELGVSKREAFEIWRDLNLALMPYTAPRLAALEVTAPDGAAGAALGAGALHLLAAQQIAGMLSGDPAGMLLGDPAGSARNMAFDAVPQPIDNAAFSGRLPSESADDRPLE
jgi:hypothetical protein